MTAVITDQELATWAKTAQIGSRAPDGTIYAADFSRTTRTPLFVMERSLREIVPGIPECLSWNLAAQLIQELPVLLGRKPSQQITTTQLTQHPTLGDGGWRMGTREENLLDLCGNMALDPVRSSFGERCFSADASDVVCHVSDMSPASMFQGIWGARSNTILASILLVRSLPVRERS